MCPQLSINLSVWCVFCHANLSEEIKFCLHFVRIVYRQLADTKASNVFTSNLSILYLDRVEMFPPNFLSRSNFWSTCFLQSCFGFVIRQPYMTSYFNAFWPLPNPMSRMYKVWQYFPFKILHCSVTSFVVDPWTEIIRKKSFLGKISWT